MEPFVASNKTDYEILSRYLPDEVASLLVDLTDVQDIILDINRPLIVRYTDKTVATFCDLTITNAILANFANLLNTQFTFTNRCGVQNTLHRVSRILDKDSKPVGYTIRIGRVTPPQISLIADVIDSGKNVLIVGKPGVGKTSLLRHISAYLADDDLYDTIIVDKSNEIGGDGASPHLAVGNARRLSVPLGQSQAGILLQAVENHSPSKIIVDEISNREEALAVQTIGERGVQVVGTVHGSGIDNIMNNPLLKYLVGNVKSVTLSTDEAKRRGCSQTILEREFNPAFDCIVELKSFDSVMIYMDVTATVDAILRGETPVGDFRLA